MKKVFSLIISAAALISCRADYTQYVNPFIGTDELGHCHPFACVPFGNTQVGPQTGSCGWNYSGGYLYDDKNIQGFIHNAVNGTGVPDLGDILIFPFCRELTEYSSTYDKSGEHAHPGYYEVYLKDAGVHASMSAAAHTSIETYVFDNPSSARVLIDFQNTLVKEDWLVPVHIKESSQSLDGPRRISGWARSNVWVDRYYYYVIEFDHDIASREILALRDAREKAPRWLLEMDMGEDSTLKVKVSVSSESIEGAASNIAMEIGDWNQDRIRRCASKQWNKYLSLIEIEGTDQQKDIFYTTMYHLFTQPGNIADAGQKPLYSTLSLWDTFRATHPLYTIITPERAGEMVESILDLNDSLGWLPIWNLWGKDNYCMIGNHAVPVIVDAYLKGIPGFDPERAYEAIRHSLTSPLPKSDWYIYDKYGYFPFDFIPKESVSKTLECGFDDWCAARMARRLGKMEDAEFFLRRSGYWKNLFDPRTLMARARDSEGAWREPFNPFYMSHEAAAGGDYTEGNAWQYTWHVLQDIPGLIDAMGGEDVFCDRLDALFETGQSDAEGGRSDAYGGRIGQYVHGNEPSHHIAYLYALAGRPDRTQDRLHQIIRTQYADNIHGFAGNDDCGQMSAWYIFTTLGFYPVNPCSGEYVLGIPMVKKATVHLGAFRKLVITREGDGIHAGKVYYGGAALNGPVISHEQIMRGGKLIFNCSE
ncbi:MAG: GH92 family glycosyl hydrolase [Bacteroidales bacterium]|nr:GH92 family glycosyl hydrolase [Bacteroidales bacterium]